MRKVKLKEICIINPPLPKNLRASQHEKISFVPMSSLSSSGSIEHVEIKEIHEVLKGYKYFERGDVLFAKITPCMENGKAGLVSDIPTLIGFGSTEFHVIRPSVSVNAKYLSFYIRQQNFRKLAEKSMTGSAGQKRVPAKFLENHIIPLPPLEDQIRIATLLSRVETMIATRKDSLHLLDKYLKSIFLVMFGDPVQNVMGWNKPELKSFGKITTGNTPPRNNAENYSASYIEWIKTDNIDQNQMFLTRASEFLSKTGAKRARTVSLGALLVACIAGSIESIGRAALSDREVSFNQQINAIQPYSDINPLFLYWLFRISKVYVQNFASNGMKKILTKGNFEKITMIKPSIEIQNQFASIVENAESLKILCKKSLNLLEKLYAGLSQKAFKGELDLSRIPLDIKPRNTLTTRKEDSVYSVSSVVNKKRSILADKIWQKR